MTVTQLMTGERVREEVRYFLVALQFLTRIPVPSFDEFEPAWLDRSSAYFPLVGLLAGALSATVLLAATPFWLSPIPAMLAVGAGIAITGAFHEDGLADLADSLGGQTREQRLAIMKDSRIGTYGTCALVAVLGLKIASLAMMAPVEAACALLAVHAAARVVPVVASAFLPYGGDRDESKVPPMQPTQRRLVFAVFCGLVPMLVFGLVAGIAALVIAAGLSALLLKHSLHSIGGQTGDVLGGAEQVFETAALLVLAGNWA